MLGGNVAFMIKHCKRQFNSGFTMVELMATIVVFAVIMAVAIPSFRGYNKKMDMIDANESARQIYEITQNKLSAMKVAGQLRKDQLEDEYGLFDVLPSESAAEMASVDGIQYYYMNTKTAVAFLKQAGHKLDGKLVNKQASIVIEMDPQNGYVYGVFYATYPESNETPFDYSSTDGTYGLQNGTEEFRISDTLRSQNRTRIGYYGGETALLEYEAGLKTPLMEIINEEELILKLSSYNQPSDFTGYQVKVTGKGDLFGGKYEYECYIDKEKFIKKDGVILEGNYYNLLLDSLASGYSINYILKNNFYKKNILSSDYKDGDNITISVEAVTKNGTDIEKHSFSNMDEESSLYAERKENDEGNTVISVSNARHLQNLNKISDTMINNSSTQVSQIKDIDWQNTITYYQTLATWNEIDIVENAPQNRIQIGGSSAKFTSITNGKYRYSAKKNTMDGIKDSTEKGYCILNLPIEGDINAGLFATFSGSLEYINLVNITVQGIENVGALVGAYQATDVDGIFNKILNCNVYLDKDLSPNPAVFSYDNYNIKSGSQSTGGLVGVVHSGEIKNSFAAIGVVGRNGGAGGFVGDFKSGKIISSYSTGQVSGMISGGGDEIALGGFIGICTNNTEVSHCYTTSEITSMKSNMGSFVGKVKSPASSLNITKSYATGGLVSTLNWENITQIDFIGGNNTIKVGNACFYLGNEESNGAKGLNLKQFKGLQDVRLGLRLDDIYTIDEGWRYPNNYGTESISESLKLTHPYYLDQRLSKVNDRVYPYSGLIDMDAAITPIPHYGDWSLSKEEMGGGSFIFYYEKYANNEYGVYYLVKETVAVNTLRKDEKILKWGYGIIAETSKINSPMDIYIRNEDGSGTILAPESSKKISDWVDSNALTVTGVDLENSFRFYAFTDASMELYLNKIQNPTYQYLYTIIESAGLYNMFNPSFAAAIHSKPVEQVDPAQMPVVSLGTAQEPFKIRHSEHFYYMGNKGYDGVESDYFYFEQTHYIDFQDDFIYVKQGWNSQPYSFRENFNPKVDRYNGEFAPANPYLGVYNGNGFDIRGYVRRSTWGDCELLYDGLFGYIGDGIGKGQISNVNLYVNSVNILIEKSQAAGIFAGYVGENSMIQNCHVRINDKDEIKQPIQVWKNTGIPYGGFVGSSSGNINNSTLKSNREFLYTYYTERNNKQMWRDGSMGGFAGENKATGTMYECNVEINGIIGSDTSAIAGFIGSNENLVKNCNATYHSKVEAAYVYGFVGRNKKEGQIQECKVNANILNAINYRYAIGFVGGNEGRIEYSNVHIKEILGAKTYGFALENISEKAEDKPSIVNCSVISEVIGLGGVDGENAESVGFVGENNGEVASVSVTVSKEMSAHRVYGFAIKNHTNGALLQSEISCNWINASIESFGFIDINQGLIQNITAEIKDNHGKNIAYGFIYRNDETGIIQNSVLTGNSVISNDDTHGYVWENKGLIENTQVNISGELRAQRVYGFAYANYKTIKNSALVCNTITGTGDVCGFARLNSGEIVNATVEIVDNDNSNTTGMIKGQNVYGFIMQNLKNGIIQDSFISSKEATTSEKIVGFVYENNGVIKAEVTGCYANIPVITPSYSEAAGFVIINTGYILGKAPDIQNETDAIFNQYVGNDIQTTGKSAGFVFDNKGVIEYAAVNSIDGVTMKSGGDSAGFASINEGNIKNSYANVNVTSLWGNIAGFVFNNLNSVESSYNQGHLFSDSTDKWNLSIGGFAYRSKGNIFNCFSISSMQNYTKGGKTKTAGFVAYADGGNIINSYSISKIEEGNSVPYLFEGDALNIANSYYLNWDGIKHITTSTDAEAKEMAELQRLVVEDKLPSSIWQSNDNVTTTVYTYPTIIGLPLPNPPSWIVLEGDVSSGDISSGDVSNGDISGGDNYH